MQVKLNMCNYVPIVWCVHEDHAIWHHSHCPGISSNLCMFAHFTQKIQSSWGCWIKVNIWQYEEKKSNRITNRILQSLQLSTTFLFFTPKRIFLMCQWLWSFFFSCRHSCRAVTFAAQKHEILFIQCLMCLFHSRLHLIFYISDLFFLSPDVLYMHDRNPSAPHVCFPL